MGVHDVVPWDKGLCMSSGFQERVPLPLRSQCKETLFFGRMLYREGISIKEERAATAWVRHLLRDHRNRGQLRLRQQKRTEHTHWISCSFVEDWMPSERTPSDRPSRRCQYSRVKPMRSTAPIDGKLSRWRAALRCPLLAADTHVVENN